MKTQLGAIYLSEILDRHRNSPSKASNNRIVVPTFRKVMNRSMVSSKGRYNYEGRSRLNLDAVAPSGATYRFGIWHRYYNRDR